MKSKDHRNLFRKKGTRFWWFQAQHNGQTIYRSTKTDQLDQAIVIRDCWLKEIEDIVAVESLDTFRGNLPNRKIYRKWRKYIDAIASEKVNWIYNMHRRARERAKKNNVEFTLSLEDLVEMVKKTGGICSVSYLAFTDEKFPGMKDRPYFPSLDRVQFDGPYSKGNCRIVCNAVNKAMSRWGEGIIQEIQAGYLRYLKRGQYNEVAMHTKL